MFSDLGRFSHLFCSFLGLSAKIEKCFYIPVKRDGITSVPNLDILLRKAATDKNITYMLIKSVDLLYENPEAWIQTFRNMSADSLQKPAPALFQ